MPHENRRGVFSWSSFEIADYKSLKCGKINEKKETEVQKTQKTEVQKGMTCKESMR